MTWFWVLLLNQNRNAACGLYKDEIINQLRELVKLEPNLNCENMDAEPLTGFQPLLSVQNVQQGDMVTGFADNAEPFVFPRFEVNFLLCWYSANCFLMLATLLFSIFKLSFVHLSNMELLVIISSHLICIALLFSFFTS